MQPHQNFQQERQMPKPKPHKSKSPQLRSKQQQPLKLSPPLRQQREEAREIGRAMVEARFVTTVRRIEAWESPGRLEKQRGNALCRTILRSSPLTSLT